MMLKKSIVVFLVIIILSLSAQSVIGQGAQDSFRWQHQYRHEINQGVENGTVVMESNITKQDGNIYITSYQYQHGMTLDVEGKNEYSLMIKVSAEFQEGKILVLNIEKNVFRLKNSKELSVKFDGSEVREADIDEVIDGEGGEAQYTLALGADGQQVIFYIPHFSEHSISLEVLGVGITESQANILLIGALAAAMITIVVLVVNVIRTGRFKKD